MERLSRNALVVSLLMVAACTSEPPARDAGVTEDTASESIVDIALRHFNQVPDSVLLRRGACPFECCVYGAWRATTGIPLRQQPAQQAPLATTLSPGTRFQADSGHVRVTGPAIVVIDDTVFQGAVRRVQFVPGDTLVVLDYVGEGHFNLWNRGRVAEAVGGFWGAEVDSPRGSYFGDYRKEWWVHATDGQGRSGWFRADSTFRYSGADACAG